MWKVDPLKMQIGKLRQAEDFQIVKTRLEEQLTVSASKCNPLIYNFA